MKQWAFVFVVAICFQCTLALNQKVWRDVVEAESPSFLVYLNRQADLKSIRSSLHDKSTAVTRSLMGQWMQQTLQVEATQSQASLMAWLREQDLVADVRSLWISNCVVVDLVGSLDPDSAAEFLERLLARDEVAILEPNYPFQVPVEDDAVTESLTLQLMPADSAHPSTGDRTVDKLDDLIEWNIEWVKAPVVWNISGQGEGMIYGNADTGVQWRHESLIGNYFGAKLDGTGQLVSVNHNYSWFDGVRKPLLAGLGPCGVRSEEPCDDNGHGTHTTSTAVGSRGVGVAPGARWMACRNMDRGYGRSETYLNCLQYFFAPTDLEGRNPNASLRPHAIGNSYGCPSNEGCATHAFTKAVENLRLAGVFMSVSAGNEGPGCSTVEAPPGYEPAVISVGATSKNSPRITYFSSRGPSYHLGRDLPVMKPDVTAPGEMVLGAYPRQGSLSRYAVLSGTSMASPHVGGAVLLLTQACPCLSRDVDALQLLLQDTADHYTTSAPETFSRPCGEDAADAVPNNVYGYGGIELERALKLCRARCSA